MPIATQSDVGAFVPAALVIAREYRSLSQKELAERSGLSRQTIASLESGATQPGAETVGAIAHALTVRPDFLLREPVPPPPSNVLHFRGKPRVTARESKRLLAHASFSGAFADELRGHARLPKDGLVGIDTSGSADDVAARTRKAWGIHEDAPIHSVVRLVERAGAFVGTLHAGEDGLDAYSWIHNGTHVICNVDRSTGTRMRFSLLHETAHLILHRDRETGDEETEKEADRFASAMLLPRRAFWQEFPRGTRLDWPALFAMKRRWGASVAAIVTRARDLGLIDAVKYRRAFMHMSSQRWRKYEPGEPDVSESPELVPRLLESLARERGLTPNDIGARFGLYTEEISTMAGTDVSAYDQLRTTAVRLRSPTS